MTISQSGGYRGILYYAKTNIGAAVDPYQITLDEIITDSDYSWASGDGTLSAYGEYERTGAWSTMAGQTGADLPAIPSGKFREATTTWVVHESLTTGGWLMNLRINRLDADNYTMGGIYRDASHYYRMILVDYVGGVYTSRINTSSASGKHPYDRGVLRVSMIDKGDEVEISTFNGAHPTNGSNYSGSGIGAYTSYIRIASRPNQSTQRTYLGNTGVDVGKLAFTDMIIRDI